MISLKKLMPYFLCSLTLALVSFTATYNVYKKHEIVDLKNIKALQAEIKINAGKLKLTANEQTAAGMNFEYTNKGWKPEIKINKEKGHLSVLHPEQESTDMKEGDKNEWEIKLPIDLPTNLKIIIGAGEGTIDLKGAKLKQLEMNAGAGKFLVNLSNTSVADIKMNAGVGELTLDLTGKRSSDLKGEINGGIGDMKLILPQQTGVRVKVNGLGSFDKGGLKKKDGYYVNDAYGRTEHSLDLVVSGGLGSLKMSLVK